MQVSIIKAAYPGSGSSKGWCVVFVDAPAATPHDQAYYASKNFPLDQKAQAQQYANDRYFRWMGF